MRLATTTILFVLSLAWLMPTTEIHAASVAQSSTTQTTVITKTVTTQTVTTQTTTTQTTTTLPEIEVVVGDGDLLGSVIAPLEPVGQCAEPSPHGLLFPSVGDNGLFGYVNHSGDFVIEPRYILGGEFSWGVAAVSLDGESFGYIDGRGNEVIPAQFADAGAFSEGIAVVRSADPVDEWLLELSSSAYVQLSGYINCNGRYVIEPQYPLAEPFRNGLAKVFTQDYTFVYIDWAGNVMSSEIQLDFETAQMTVYRNEIGLPDEERPGSCEPFTAFGEHPSLFQCDVEGEVYELCIRHEDGETIVCGYPFEPFIAETTSSIDLTCVQDFEIPNLRIDLLDGRSCERLAEPLSIADEGRMGTHRCTDGSYLRGEPSTFEGRELQFAENVILTEGESVAAVVESTLVPVSGIQSFDTALGYMPGGVQTRPIPPSYFQSYWTLR